eukprot:447979-Rhodomonas_salina.1
MPWQRPRAEAAPGLHCTRECYIKASPTVNPAGSRGKAGVFRASGGNKHVIIILGINPVSGEEMGLEALTM